MTVLNHDKPDTMITRAVFVAAQVPLFRSLSHDKEFISDVAEALSRQERVVLPGALIIAKGEIGEVRHTMTAGSLWGQSPWGCRCVVSCSV